MKLVELLNVKQTQSIFSDKELIQKSINSGSSEVPKEIASGSFEDFNKWMLTDTRVKK